MSKYVIPSKAIVRDLERGRESSTWRFRPGKLVAILAFNLALGTALLLLAVAFDLI